MTLRLIVETAIATGAGPIAIAPTSARDGAPQLCVITRGLLLDEVLRLHDHLREIRQAVLLAEPDARTSAVAVALSAGMASAPTANCRRVSLPNSSTPHPLISLDAKAIPPVPRKAL